MEAFAYSKMKFNADTAVSHNTGDDSALLLQNNLKECIEENNKLTEKIKMMRNNSNNNIKSDSTEPSLSHETHLRKIHNNIQETWYSSKRQILNLKGISDEERNNIIAEMREQKNAALVEVELLQAGNEDWRRNEAQELQNIAQQMIQYVQNPPECSTARKLLCNINKGCGFGCQIHHVTFCFLIAFGTERTLILNSKNWRYSKEGFESIFLPISETCTDASGATTAKWTDEESTTDTQVVSVGIVDSMHKRPPYLPLTIPRDLGTRIMRLHGNPAVWWLSQFIRYLMRMQPDLEKTIEKFKEDINFKSPIVGIHIRRTDKVGSEAALHKLSEYMDHVDSWYEKEILKRQRLGESKIAEPRTVYIATDDPSVFKEAQSSYPTYKFLNDPKIVQSASVGKRYSKEGLIGVITDIILLSECNFIVGTFSSQVSRMGYELMQTLHADASTYAHSLDDIFYFGGQSAHSEKVIYENKPKDGAKSLELDVGDIVGIAGNHWDGFSKGKKSKSGEMGLYPSYKTEDVINIVDFPTYPKSRDIKLNQEFKVH